MTKEYEIIVRYGKEHPFRDMVCEEDIVSDEYVIGHESAENAAAALVNWLVKVLKRYTPLDGVYFQSTDECVMHVAGTFTVRETDIKSTVIQWYNYLLARRVNQ